MKPTIGRIVHCNAGNAHPPARAEPLPAMIVTTHKDGTVDLNVFGDMATFRGRGQTNMTLEKVREGKPDGEGQRWWWPPRDASALGTSDQPQGGGEPVSAGASSSDVGVDGQTVVETDANGEPVG